MSYLLEDAIVWKHLVYTFILANNSSCFKSKYPLPPDRLHILVSMQGPHTSLKHPTLVHMWCNISYSEWGWGVSLWGLVPTLPWGQGMEPFVGVKGMKEALNSLGVLTYQNAMCPVNLKIP